MNDETHGVRVPAQADDADFFTTLYEDLHELLGEGSVRRVPGLDVGSTNSRICVATGDGGTVLITDSRDMEGDSASHELWLNAYSALGWEDGAASVSEAYEASRGMALVAELTERVKELV